MPNLFSSLTIKNIQLQNRIVMPPMALEYATEDGEVTKKTINHYVERAKYGVGLIIIEHSYIMPEGKYSKKQLGSYDRQLLPGLTELALTIQENNVQVVLQINHAGPRSSKEVSGYQPFSASAIDIYDQGEPPQEISQTEMQVVKESFIKAAMLAKEAGFDGVEVHGAHGFLLSSFLSPLANQRDDQYGGSLENRARFSLEIVREVRSALGDEFPLFYRLGSDDMRPGGLEVSESKIVARWLSEAGVDVMDVSGGLVGSRPDKAQPGYFVSQAAEIKREINIPVIAVGGITEPTFANEIIFTDQADLVAIGRALLKDPRWPQRAANIL